MLPQYVHVNLFLSGFSELFIYLVIPVLTSEHNTMSVNPSSKVCSTAHLKKVCVKGSKSPRGSPQALSQQDSPEPSWTFWEERQGLCGYWDRAIDMHHSCSHDLTWESASNSSFQWSACGRSRNKI